MNPDRKMHVVPEPRPSITCPKCGWISYHPVDIDEGYCGNCHQFTSRYQRERATP